MCNQNKDSRVFFLYVDLIFKKAAEQSKQFNKRMAAGEGFDSA
jgi:hypothetical protein